MTVALAAVDVQKKIEAKFPGTTSIEKNAILVKAESLLDVMSFLKKSPDLAFDYMTTITAVDYFDYFEVIYLLVSMEKNHGLTIKTRVFDREQPSLPSVISLWHSADYQEREIYDLMGIAFKGHPNLKRIVLWPEFKGYPQRRDYLQ
ncbi:MAG TPA: NADH-quinone oxidoreductase subunit C [Dehalococcoidales bacterium]|nr:NADH-quinone oxidoreductase subunit C [Dehalococcoidales bacterium]